MRKWVPVLAVLVVLSAIALLTVMASAQAQKKATGTLHIVASLGQEVAAAVKGKSIVVTLLQDGKPVAQTDLLWGYYNNWNVETGIYELRGEGEGAQTIVRRGIFVGEGRTTDVQLNGEPGTGCKVITYGTAELGRFGKSCGTDPSHLNAAPDQWQFCPVCGKKLQ